MYPEQAVGASMAEEQTGRGRRKGRPDLETLLAQGMKVPEYPDQELLFLFKDGLQAWARLEVERRGAPNLVATITIAESLIEYKGVIRLRTRMARIRVGREGVARRVLGMDRKRAMGERSSGAKEKPLGDCPKNGALDTRVVENENPPPRQEGSSMGSMQLGTIGTGKQTKVQLGNKGRLFAQIQVGQNEVQALWILVLRTISCGLKKRRNWV
ncbi:hypothetical protein GH714_022216 [Hevea brasiliensis]|uniref:Uncharacterized protein n=1 Tax=Hevea brasiliensis TaxID=3981 RepID=A0A6A6KSV0_HEVBR|nr:hypothetical protein GH714_022216 [Hevea brasiliensis]